MENQAENISRLGNALLNRRDFLRQSGMTLGGIALTQLLAQDGLLAADQITVSGKSPIRPKIDADNPYAPRPSHFPAQAKQVLVIYCPGAVSHVDTFDYKPALAKFHGRKPPGIPAVTFEGPTGNIAKPFWDFRPRGKSGKMVSDLLPNLGGLVDEFSFFHALHTQTSAHPQGENFMNTGFTLEGFPSFGGWVTYALGTENQDLPAFVAINDPRGLARSGKNNFGNGFLPAAYQGTDFNAKNPPANLDRPDAYSAADDRRAVGLLNRLNAKHLEKFPGDADLAARIASYELAGKMQVSVPEVMDLAGEPESIHKEYGTDSGTELKREYAKNCMLARRLIEKGVRVVQLFNGSDPSGGNGITNWDSHSKIKETHAMQAEIMDQPTAALIADMKRRGLLDQTLIVWATEFGRMPFLQANGTGRDHNPDAFTCFLAGAGVKKGFSYGESDEWGFKSVVDATSVYDFNATILHLMGLDHERLTYYHNGLERRLTNVHGHMVKEVLA
ncbi:MAG: sulfatase [Opitutales bacterium TMED158]|nr:MAG: sulfatase [Opitutales bacterium TMED158]